MINLECFEYNHLIVRVYRDERTRLIWFLKDDILQLFRLENKSLPDIPKEFEIQLEISVSLKLVPNLLENPKGISLKTFVSYAGLRLIFNKSRLDKSESDKIFNWIESDIIKGRGKVIYPLLSKNLDLTKDNRKENIYKIFKLSENSIESEVIALSEEKSLEIWFYKELLERLNNCNQEESIEFGVKVLLKLIEENNLEIITPEGIRLTNISVKRFETYKFLQKVRLSIESFLKDLSE